MKKIVRGNDFTLRIPVMRIVDGEQVAFPLPACTDVKVNVTNAYRRVSLPFTIDVTDDNVLLARVEGDTIALGTYALEVKGKLFGNDWRSNEYEQFRIVNNNASADTELGDTEQGESSVEMDTALAILAPSDELTGLISDTNKALDRVKAMEKELDEKTTVIDASEQGRVEAETARVKAEQARADAETARAKAEEGRVANENARVKAEVQRESDLQEAISEAGGKVNGAVAKCEADTKAATDKVKSDCKTAIEGTQAQTASAVSYAKTETDKAVAKAETDTSAAVKKADDDTQATIKQVKADAASAIKQTQDDTTAAISTMNAQATQTINALNKAKDQAVADCEEAVRKAKVSVDYDPDEYSIIINTED